MRPIPPRPSRTKTVLPDTDNLAAEILAFLADDAERIERFLASSGIAIDDLRAASTTDGFAEALLDHLCADEPLLVAFGAARGYAPEAIEARRQALQRFQEG